MLTIRKEQMQALSAYMIRSFEDRVAQHIRRTYPEQLKQMGEAATRERKLEALIGQGITQARQHGLEAERDIARYIEFLVRLGPDFENAPEFKWVRTILSEKTISARGRVELIHQQLESRAKPSGFDGQPDNVNPSR